MADDPDARAQADRGWGQNKLARRGQIRLAHSPEFAEDSRQIRGLIDELFLRDADKQQATALWAAGLGARNFTREYLR